jgi:hypothetical protein
MRMTAEIGLGESARGHHPEEYFPNVKGVPPGHEHLNIGRIKLHSSMTPI